MKNEKKYQKKKREKKLHIQNKIFTIITYIDIYNINNIKILLFVRPY